MLLQLLLLLYLVLRAIGEWVIESLERFMSEMVSRSGWCDRMTVNNISEDLGKFDVFFADNISDSLRVFFKELQWVRWALQKCFHLEKLIFPEFLLEIIRYQNRSIRRLWEVEVLRSSLRSWLILLRLLVIVAFGGVILRGACVARRIRTAAVVLRAVRITFCYDHHPSTIAAAVCLATPFAVAA